MENKLCDHLLDYFNGILEEDEKAIFEAHLANCTECQMEWEEWKTLTDDLPYLSEEVEPPHGMKDRVLSHVFTVDTTNPQKEDDPITPLVSTVRKTKSRKSLSRRRGGWLTGVLAASLLLSLGANAYFFIEKDQDNETVQEQISKTFNSVQLNSEQTNSSGTASMMKGKKTTNLVIQAHNMSQVEGSEAYQVWLIEGEKKYRAGTFVPDKNGNGTVVFPVNYPGNHKWNAVAVSHEPTANSKQPKGKIVMIAKL